ncbi:cytochrome oxidase assembly protein ShyY1 [Friedmanniella endophytica]|uniref:SURF1-like protein n=1 Tax=Microlunatus kandeliicorticis TaxID=1759536 RepID=A0A7W3IS43_9ACTN|nr:SURF1 family cytochrome oxidase biogenesis protein [Microlunatus kandeliicorticis]MBA8794228.1 cytochrome oxidase assembly protein ShyY1 [Microlunatus kandeliicorticis]
MSDRTVVQTPADADLAPDEQPPGGAAAGTTEEQTNAEEPARPVRPLWQRWVALILFVAVMGTIFVNMGDWQLRRLHQRRAANAVVIANENRPVVPFQQIFTAPIGKANEWKPVSATGTFDAAHQYIVRYRDNGGANGYEVVTPLIPSDGSMAVLVDRGFIATDNSSAIPTTAPPPPSGQVTLTGRVRRSEAGNRAAITPVDNQMRLVNAYAIATTLPYPVRDGYIDQLQVTPAQTGGFQVKVLPELSDGPHFWYAVQWFMFTGIGIAGVVVFIRGDLRERRAAREGVPPTPQGQRRRRRR